MTREECENQILEKVKEIKLLLKQYDKSEELYLSMTIYDDTITISNAYWETETPLDVIECNNGSVMHFEH